ncbi:MAG: WD40 repeat domain-containing protein [Isosphaeraceae bacterium]|nr:WD40 repeat domain-containing protein [Isosphaeraceae bacterium]
MVFSPDGRYIACGDGRFEHPEMVEVWDLRSGAKTLLGPPSGGVFHAINQLVYNKVGNLLAVFYNSSAISIIDMHTRRSIVSIRCSEQGYLSHPAFTSSDRLRFFSGRSGGPLRILELHVATGTSEVLYTLPGSDALPEAISPNGEYATVGRRHDSIVVDIDRRRALFSSSSYAVTGFIPDKDLLLSLEKRQLRLLETTSGLTVKSMDLGEIARGGAWRMEISRDGSLAALTGISINNAVRIIDLNEMREIHSIRIGPDGTNSSVVAFSGMSDLLLTSTDSINSQDRWCAPIINIWKLDAIGEVER